MKHKHVMLFLGAMAMAVPFGVGFMLIMPKEIVAQLFVLLGYAFAGTVLIFVFIQGALFFKEGLEMKE